MNTFSADNSRIIPTGINSRVIQGVPRVQTVEVPIPLQTKKQKQLKEIAISLTKILNKIIKHETKTNT